RALRAIAKRRSVRRPRAVAIKKGSNMTRVLGIAQDKGGVGKTVISRGLAEVVSGAPLFEIDSSPRMIELGKRVRFFQMRADREAIELTGGAASRAEFDQVIDAIASATLPTVVDIGANTGVQNSWRFVDDEVLLERLKEAKGIGTPATRAEIIGGLKKQGFLIAQGKHIVPTETGLSLFGVLKQADPALVDPGVTAQLECLLDDVVVGKQEMVGAIDAVCDVAKP